MSDTPITLVITNAGMDRFTAAQGDEDIDLTIAEVGLTDTAFTANAALVALPSEFRRLTTVAGEAVGDDTIHLTLTDDGVVAYGVRGFGLFLADGTLFAAYGQTDRIAVKAEPATLMIAIDVAFPVSGVDQITFGDLGFLNPPATTTTRGVVELATQAEANAGAAGPLVISAALWKILSAALAAGLVPTSRLIHSDGLLTGGASLAGDLTLDVPRALAADVLAATDATKAVTPASLTLGRSLGTTGYDTLPGGRIVQWGRYRASVSSESTASITFPVAFPSACFAVQLTGFIPGADVHRDLWPQLAGEAATTGITVQFQSDDDDYHSLSGFDWVAIGN